MSPHVKKKQEYSSISSKILQSFSLLFQKQENGELSGLMARARGWNEISAA
jgi:hypothetical protein